MRGEVRQWSVQILVGESEGGTFAEAALCDDGGRRARGRGHADPPQPADSAVPWTPAEVAVARALDDLSRELLHLKGASTSHGQRP